MQTAVKIAKTILARVWWLGRGTATIMGIAMMLALTVGLASTALAGTGIGARFDLGKINTINKVSQLVGSTDNAMLRIDNDSRDANATALDLRVDAATAKPPMRVNSIGKVDNLNADLLNFRRADQFAFGTNGVANNANLLDGKNSTAFVPTKIYEVQDQRTGSGGNSIEARFATCDAGDPALSGGGFSTDPSGDTLVSSFRSSASQWQVVYRDGGGANSLIGAKAYCADLPPLR